MAENNEKDDPNKGLDSDAEVTAPVVFQCDKCRTVLGDSYSFVSSDTELQTLTLEGALNVDKSIDASTSKRGRDAGSTYNILTCAYCKVGKHVCAFARWPHRICFYKINIKNVVGRVYLTTARHLDAIRDMYTFDTGAISSYELGTNVYTSNVTAENGLDSPDTAVLSTIDEFRRDMTKVQNIILVLDERIQKIEKHQQTGTEKESPGNVASRIV